MAEGSEINGSEGDIQVTGANGSPQLVQHFIKGGRGEDKELRPLDIPQAGYAGWPTAAFGAGAFRRRAV